MAPRIGRPPLAAKPSVSSMSVGQPSAPSIPPKPSQSVKGYSQHPDHEWKKGGDDWSTWMNPKSAYVQNSNLAVDLVHSLDHERYFSNLKTQILVLYVVLNSLQMEITWQQAAITMRKFILCQQVERFAL